MSSFLVFGGTGQTGKHFLRLALDDGHRVRAVARDPRKLPISAPGLDVRDGSITAVTPDLLAGLLDGVDYVVAMLGDREAQQHDTINTTFTKALVPAMRAAGVRRYLYQAGGLSSAPGRHLLPPVWAVKHTLARSYLGQHRDNEAVMRYLIDDADDIEWSVHRAGIGGDGPSKGTLQRSTFRPSIATFVDCAAYNYRTVMDPAAVHTCDFSRYAKAGTQAG